MPRRMQSSPAQIRGEIPALSLPRQAELVLLVVEARLLLVGPIRMPLPVLLPRASDACVPSPSCRSSHLPPF